jgi:hypothetical protein
MPMRSSTVLLGFLLVTTSCSESCRDGCNPRVGGSLADDDAGFDAGTSKLAVTELARANDRFQGLGLDESYVYVGAMVQGPRRVPKAGGPLEKVGNHGSAGPAGKPDPTRAYFNGYPSIEQTQTVAPGADSFSIDADGIYRTSAAGKKELIARSFQDAAWGNVTRKVIVLDDANVYWLETSAAAIFSVPRAGGAAAFVVAAKGSLETELAIFGDTIFEIDIDGTFTSVKKNGSDLKFVGSLSYELGPNRNGIWAAVDANFLYVASDATETMGTTATPLGGTRVAIDTSGTPVFDSRIVKVALPVGGEPLPPSRDGVIFPLNVYLGDLDADDAALRRGLDIWKPFLDLLAKGKVPITISLGGNAVDANVETHLAKIETWLRTNIGGAVKIERTNIAAAVPAQSVVIGFPYAATPTLLAPAENKH